MSQANAEFQEKMMREILESEKLRVSILAALFFLIAMVDLIGPLVIPGMFPEEFSSVYRVLPLYQWIAFMFLFSCVYQLFVTNSLQKSHFPLFHSISF